MVVGAAKVHRPDSVATWIIALVEFTAIRPMVFGLLGEAVVRMCANAQAVCNARQSDNSLSF